jgi:hypothetical protein
MSESGSGHVKPGEAGMESHQAQSSTLGGLWADPHLSASVMSSANEGSRNKRRPWLWALGWVGGIVVVIAGLVLILR